MAEYVRIGDCNKGDRIRAYVVNFSSEMEGVITGRTRGRKQVLWDNGVAYSLDKNTLVERVEKAPENPMTNIDPGEGWRLLKHPEDWPFIAGDEVGWAEGTREFEKHGHAWAPLDPSDAGYFPGLIYRRRLPATEPEGEVTAAPITAASVIEKADAWWNFNDSEGHCPNQQGVPQTIVRRAWQAATSQALAGMEEIVCPGCDGSGERWEMDSEEHPVMTMKPCPCDGRTLWRKKGEQDGKS